MNCQKMTWVGMAGRKRWMNITATVGSDQPANHHHLLKGLVPLNMFKALVKSHIDEEVFRCIVLTCLFEPILVHC
jgi:hypothetical protein